MEEASAGNRKRVLDAAVACFAKHGAENTTMEDIADAAGLGRKTVYRTFPNRNALIDAVAVERINVWRDAIKDVVDSSANFEEAVTNGIVESLLRFRQDRILMSAIAATHDHGVERYLIDPKSPMMERMLYAWKGAFTRARKSGQLRQDLSDEEVSSWLLGVYLILLLREDIAPSRQEALISSLVMPGLAPGKFSAAAKPRRKRARL